MAQDNQEKIDDYGQIFFSWKFLEFYPHQRTKTWYIWGGIFVVLLLIYSIFSANVLFGLITVLSTLIVLLFQQKNEYIDFKITEDGILVNGKFYKYKEIKNFYIIYEPPEVKTLYFEPKSVFSPRIPVFLEDQNPVKIREVLKKYLDEDLAREEEPTSDSISRIFKL
ncbi:MAG: DUF5673 domain-containing protein [Candidatus Buchananbacteria bacterium]